MFTGTCWQPSVYSTSLHNTFRVKLGDRGGVGRGGVGGAMLAPMGWRGVGGAMLASMATYTYIQAQI